MADQREIYTRARLLASAAQLGGKHLKEANQELKDLQTKYNVAEYNALLMAIRMYNMADRKDNLHLPKLIFSACLGGAVPDAIVAHHDSKPTCSPEAERFIRTALENLENNTTAINQAAATRMSPAVIAPVQRKPPSDDMFPLDEYLTFTNESLMDSLSTP